MPDRSKHEAQARGNAATSSMLSANGEFAWSVTVMFYAALHWVDAYLAGNKTPISHPANHGERLDQIVDSKSLYSTIYNHYRDLFERSMDARYLCTPFTKEDVDRLRAKRYQAIEDTIRKLLG